VQCVRKKSLVFVVQTASPNPSLALHPVKMLC
jgi:hypothetical protein